MINRIFFITEMSIPYDGNLPAEENVHFSLPVDPFLKDALENAYNLLSHAEEEAGSPPSPMALTLEIHHALTAAHIRWLTSFLFIPSYLSIGNSRVINLSGDSPELLTEAAAAISGFLSTQGMSEVIINTILPYGKSSCHNGNCLFDTQEELTGYYTRILQTDPGCHHKLFFRGYSAETFRAVLSSLQGAEMEFTMRFPGLYSLCRTNGLLEKELYTLRRKQASLEKELDHQLQYVDMLRSDHQAKELQDYYTHEYEVLPLWYRRFGQILKVITGKRTFKSLFRHDVKKYKD
jgi:hypothetical protein